MTGFQSDAFPESRPTRLMQRNGGAIIDTADSPREPMHFGEKVGLVLTICASAAVVIGGSMWLAGLIQ